MKKMKQRLGRTRVGKTSMISCLLLCSLWSTGWSAKIVYPWRATTAIVITNQTFEVWFSADSGQNLNSVQLKSPYKTVAAVITATNTTATWTYDPVSGNTCNRKYTVKVPYGTPADRYDLVLKTSTGDVISAGAVKVIHSYKADYYVVHFSDVHRWQADYNVDYNLRKVSEILKMASLINAQMVFETGDNAYWLENHPEREDAYHNGVPADGVIGMSDTMAATFITAGNHDTPKCNYELEASPQVCATFWNKYYGLQNHNFKYGNGRFVLFNNAWGAGSAYTYQKDGALSWLNGAGTGGNFLLAAGHWTDWFAQIDSAQIMSMGIYGHAHLNGFENPYDVNGLPKGYCAITLRDNKLMCNVFRVNNNTGTYTPVGGSTAVVNLLTSGNLDPATWVMNLTQSYSKANNGSFSSNTATVTNKFNFALYGANIRFVVPKGNTYTVSKGTITQAFDGTSFHIVDVTVDLNANSTTTVSISPSASNLPPYFTSDPFSKPDATAGVAYDEPFSGKAVDPESGTMTFSKTAGPAWLSVTSNGNAQGTPGSVDVGMNSFMVKVTDDGGLSDTATMTINVLPPANLPPYFTSNPFSKPDATAGVAYNEPFSGKAADPESGTMTFSKVSGPAWLSVTTNGNAQGTPGSVDIGTNSFVVRVTDNGGLSATATMTINVIGVPQTVTFTSVAADDGYVNESSETSNIGGSLNSTQTAGAGLRIGDMNDKRQVKTVVSFDTASIPDGAVILSATLKLNRGLVSGTPTNLGAIRVDIKGGSGFNNVAALENADFQAAADSTNVATMSYPSANGNWSTGSLNTTGLTKVNKTGKTQLRVYFATDDNNDAVSDYLGFLPGDSTNPDNRPVFEIIYQ